MSEEQNKKKNPFSIYWIYAAIAIAIIGFQIFMSSGNRITVTYISTFDDLAVKGFVKNAKMVNKGRIDFKITEEGRKYIQASKDKQYKAIKSYLSKGTNMKSNDPTFELKIIDAANFETHVRQDINTEIKEDNKERAKNKEPLVATVELIDTEEVNYFESIFSFLFIIR